MIEYENLVVHFLFELLESPDLQTVVNHSQSINQPISELANQPFCYMLSGHPSS